MNYRLYFGLPFYFLSYYLPSPYLPIIGKFCSRIRSTILHFINPHISQKSTIGKRCYFGNPQNLHIVSGSSIGNDFKMHNSFVIIDKNVMIASDVNIWGGGHYTSDTSLPMISQGDIGKTSLIIEEDVWIGARTTILAKGQIIGKGSVIGAGSVITKEVPPYSILAGNPAKIIRKRK
ncbi:MAG: acyltransferase [Muribaculaceae bacterium]|nr:acyltransferase [Muribaculaceae bacterium]